MSVGTSLAMRAGRLARIGSDSADSRVSSAPHSAAKPGCAIAALVKRTDP